MHSYKIMKPYLFAMHGMEHNINKLNVVFPYDRNLK